MMMPAITTFTSERIAVEHGDKEGREGFCLCVTITMFTFERITTEHGVTMKHYHEAPMMDSSKQTNSQSNWISASDAFLLW